MAYTTIVGTHDVARRLNDPDWIAFDCRHDLANPEAGATEYAKAHIPGAHFLHLDRDLAAKTTGSNGRHPLPDPNRLASRLAECGMASAKQAVAYDAQGGAFAARLWWLLKWLGHDAVAVLDGGWQKWLSEHRPVNDARPKLSAGDFLPALQGGQLEANDVLQCLGKLPLVDARAPDRYRGENETLDPVGGRIPGALNRFYRDNLDASGQFKSAAALKGEFDAVLKGARAEDVVHYCGSGVTACHNLLAMTVAGFPATRLYPGSWSEWCADPSRPVARGEP